MPSAIYSLGFVGAHDVHVQVTRKHKINKIFHFIYTKIINKKVKKACK